MSIWKIRYIMRGTAENSFCYSVDSLASRTDISMTKEKDNSVQISSSHRKIYLDNLPIPSHALWDPGKRRQHLLQLSGMDPLQKVGGTVLYYP